MLYVDTLDSPKLMQNCSDTLLLLNPEKELLLISVQLGTNRTLTSPRGLLPEPNSAYSSLFL